MNSEDVSTKGTERASPNRRDGLYTSEKAMLQWYILHPKNTTDEYGQQTHIIEGKSSKIC
jgi:hypothetical protein